MKLYCVRHGEANSIEVDSQLGLSNKGKMDIEKLSTFFRDNKIHVSHVMHSPKLRTTQTAEILAEGVDAEDVTVCEHLLDADNSIQPILDMIPAWSEDTMLVGHMPYMSMLVNALILGDEHQQPIISFLPGTIVCLEYYENQRWRISSILKASVV